MVGGSQSGEKKRMGEACVDLSRGAKRAPEDRRR